MDVVFPDIPAYEGWSAPMRSESTIQDLELVSGSVPRDIAGTLYRCGPDRQYPPMSGEDIFIDGEGMAHMWRFADGHVDYRSRWMRNERFLLQEDARRSLFGRYRNRYTNDPSVAGKSMGTANTNAVFHGGRLLVLKEDSLPFEADPDTLESIGEWDFYGEVRSKTLSAHPKIDLITNEMITYGHQAKGDGTTDMVYYVIGADGHVAHEVWFHAPYPGVVHDFGVTESHVIFPFFPLITDVDVLKKGGTFYEWHPDQPTMYAILPRRGTAEDIRWFKGPATSAGHMMNAFTEGAKVHLDICLYHGNCFPFFPAKDGSFTTPVPPQLTRLTFDMTSNTDDFESDLLLAAPGEMPRMDDRYMGKKNRYGFLICRPADAKVGDTVTANIGRFDFETRALETWSPGANRGVQEPIFVPRSPNAPESDGYLMVIVNRFDEGYSDLAILDAGNIARGPVAVLKMGVRVRSTFHGMWVPDWAFETGRFDFPEPV